MKYIIIGQLMFWVNIASIITGYMITRNFPLNEFVIGLMAFISIIGSIVNMFFSVIVQVKGYSTLGVLPE